MSKHPLEASQTNEIWKYARYSAYAVAAVGGGWYAASWAMKSNNGLNGLYQGVKSAIQCTRAVADANVEKPPPTDQAQPAHQLPIDAEEKRAVLDMRLGFAIERGDEQRAQELVYEIDQLDATKTANTTKPIMLAPVPPTDDPLNGSPFARRQLSTPPARDSSRSMDDGKCSAKVSTATAATVPVQQQKLASGDNGLATMNNMPSQLATNTTGPGGHSVAVAHAIASVDGSADSAQHRQPQILQTPPPAEKQQTLRPTGPSVPVAGTIASADGSVDSAQHVNDDQRLKERQEAIKHIQPGDVVHARDPFNREWSCATIVAMAKNGLVHVRWHEPGYLAQGQPFSPIGEVWAEEIVVKYRKPTAPVSAEPRKPLPVAPERTELRGTDGPPPAVPLDGLQVGDSCFALGKVVEDKWFQARLLATRARSPPLRVEYLSTLDGDPNPLLLPSSRKDFVHVEHVRRDKPSHATAPPTRAKADGAVPVPQMVVRGATESQETHSPQVDGTVNKANDHATPLDSVVVDEDLMCSICERPDDEAHMLVCDCKKGFHIYCLSPALNAVPEGDWTCPTCESKK